MHQSTEPRQRDSFLPPGCTAGMISRAADGPPERPFYVARPAEPETELRGMPGTRNVQGLFTSGDHYLGSVVWIETGGYYVAVDAGFAQLPGTYTSEDSAADAIVEAREVDDLD